MNKKILSTLAAAVLLTGCGVTESTTTIDAPAETAAVAEVYTITANTSAASEAGTAADGTKEARVDISPKEQEAIDKLGRKYGREFRAVGRDVQREYWDEKPDHLNVWYDLEDEDGRPFMFMCKENTDIAVSEGYGFIIHEQELCSEAAAYIRKVMPEGKLWFGNNSAMIPFEAAGDNSFESFRQAFIAGDGKLTLSILLTDDTEIPGELKVLMAGRSDIKPAELGYTLYINYYKLAKEDYDSLPEVVYGDSSVDRSKLERFEVK